MTTVCPDREEFGHLLASVTCPTTSGIAADGWTHRTGYERGNDEVGGGQVGGQRNVVDIADAKERADVGIVRLRGQGIDEKEHAVDAAGGGQRGDLSVATLWARKQL